MTLPSPTIIDPHQQIRLLLPWYANQTLSFEEQDRVENHLRHCPSCRRELVSLKSLAKALTEAPESGGDAETSFIALRAKLPLRKAPVTLSTIPANTATRDKSRKFSRQNSIRFALAASLLLAVIPLILHIQRTHPTEGYYMLSDNRPETANAKDLRIVFAKSLSNAEIDAILAKIHAHRINAPNSVGAITVRLDDDQKSDKQTADAVDLLRRNHDILLAEPVAQP
ncbi:MAG: zf-HC2 domain-containing protein [Methylomicrobium sp.]